MRILALVALLVSVLWLQTDAVSDEPRSAPEAGSATKQPGKPSPTPPKRLFTGQVVLLREALKRRGIESAPEMDGQVVLETPSGELIPIVADWRGRAFFQDARLRNRPVELVGFRRPGIPYLQVLMVFVIDDGVRKYVDYWCDTCAIAMYQIQPCDCCQQPIRLRFTPRDLPDYIRHPDDDAGAAEQAGR